MKTQLSREDREALITGSRGASLAAEDLDEVRLLVDLLGHESTWIEPPADLEGTVATALAVTPRRLHLRPRNWRRLVGATGFAAVLAIAVLFLGTRSTTSGEAFDAQSVAAEAGSRATASVHVTENDSGYRVRLYGAGLPRLDEDRAYYQAWMENSRGVAVPIGTFTSCDDSITLWSGAPPEKFRTITVTLESPDNDQTSTGHVLLAGRLRPA
jgi:hypothetical protein